MNPATVLHFKAQFLPLLRITPEEAHWLGSRIPLPSFSREQIDALLTEAIGVFSAQPQAVIEVPIPAWVIGDIHGNLHDLIRMLTHIGDLGGTRVVFLGDYVDRGSYSLDVLLLLLTLKCSYPRNIFLIRGNHEFAYVNEEYGFKAEMNDRFPDSDLWARCNTVFSFLPFAVDLGKIAVCLHGGIGPKVSSISSIAKITLPIENSEPDDNVSQIVWSDPSRDTEYFLTSARGRGCLFGRMAVHEFLKNTGHEKLIRAHECVTDGFALSKQCVTVFSSSNYCNRSNIASFIYLADDGKITVTNLEPLPMLVTRANANFDDVKPISAMRLPPAMKTDSFARKVVRPASLLVQPNAVKGQRRASLKGIQGGSLMPRAGSGLNITSSEV
jgi:protein phosphatase